MYLCCINVHFTSIKFKFNLIFQDEVGKAGWVQECNDISNCLLSALSSGPQAIDNAPQPEPAQALQLQVNLSEGSSEALVVSVPCSELDATSGVLTQVSRQY